MLKSLFFRLLMFFLSFYGFFSWILFANKVFWTTFAPVKRKTNRDNDWNYAEIAQLVEHNLAKVGVASSSLVFRSLWNFEISVAKRGNSSVGRAQPCQGWGREFEPRFPLEGILMPRWRNGRRARFRCECWETCRFESCSGHQDFVLQKYGEVAELVDALLWGGSDRWVVWVRVSSSSH